MKDQGQKISAKAINIWQIHAILLYSTLVLVVLGISFWFSLWNAFIYIIITLLLVLFLWEYLFLIMFRQRYFYYIITDDYVKINTGHLFNKKIIIPINKIAYIKQKRGPIVRRYELVNLELGTLVDSFEIPCVTEDMAFIIQSDITTNKNYDS